MEPELQALRGLLALWAQQVRPDREVRLAQLGRLARQEVSAQRELQDQVGALEPPARLELQDQLVALGESAPPALSEQLGPSVSPAPKAPLAP